VLQLQPKKLQFRAKSGLLQALPFSLRYSLGLYLQLHRQTAVETIGSDSPATKWAPAEAFSLTKDGVS
jgi:hypothetical protein